MKKFKRENILNQIILRYNEWQYLEEEILSNRPNNQLVNNLNSNQANI